MRRAATIIPLLFVLLLLSGCEWRDTYSGTLFLDGRHTLQQVNGDLIMLGGDAVLAPDARVAGSVYLLGGNLQISGNVAGDILLVGGTLSVEPGAAVNGTLTVRGGTLRQSPQARIAHVTIEEMQATSGPTGWALAAQVLWFTIIALLLSGVAALLVHTRAAPFVRIGEAATRHPLVASTLGLLVVIVSLSAAVLMVYTIILLPVVLLGLFCLAATVLYGWMSFGMRVSKALSSRFGWPRRIESQAFIGMLLVMVAVGIAGIIPVIGPFIVAEFTVISVGSVLLTHFGTIPFVPADARASASPTV